MYMQIKEVEIDQEQFLSLMKLNFLTTSLLKNKINE